MKLKLLTLIVGLALAASSLAQTNIGPVRLAVICDEPAAMQVADLLQAMFSKNASLALLERTEIQKVLREQATSTIGQNPLQLGKLLGADGLLIMETVIAGTNQSLGIRLVAVKPGVVLVSERFSWPLADTLSWAEGFTKHLNPLMPKLSVLPKDAIPISVVNLRSAVQSTEAQETERQLKLLAIQRLSRVRQLFVLERQQMQLLSEEKSLEGMDDSTFWSGSYLLEGIVDQNGHSKDTITINARLIPPKGSAALPIEASGTRTNLAEVVNQLAVRVNELLKVASTVTEWNAKDEAEQYIDEAKWALKWGVLSEAQAACESSWALGRRNKETAELRIQTYLAGGPPRLHYDDRGHVFQFHPPFYRPVVSELESVIRALELYQQDFRILIAAESTPDMTWHAFGRTLLRSSATCLRQWYYHPDVRATHQEQVAQLRNLARETLELISNHPPYRDLPNATVELANIKAGWGRYWLETPEQGLELYRDLARSGHLHHLRLAYANHNFVSWDADKFVNYPTDWKPNDPERIATLWSQFINELCKSTNNLTKVEGFYLAFADARPTNDDDESGPQFVESARQLFNVALKNGETYGMDGFSASDLIEDIEGLIPHTWYGQPAPPHNMAVKERLQSFKAEFAAAVERGWGRKCATVLMNYFKLDHRFDYGDFHNITLKYDFFNTSWFDSLPQGDLTALLQSLEEWNVRYTNEILARARSGTPLPYNIKDLRQQIANAQSKAALASTREQDFALLTAIDEGDANAAVAALDKGANIEARNGMGWTALIISARAGREDLVKLLLDRGADANARSTSAIGSTVLCFAAGVGNINIVRDLVRHGADVNGRATNLQAPLDLAVFKNLPEIVSFLLSKGANPNTFGPIDSFGYSQSPVTLAILNSRFDIARVLLRNGGDLELTNNVGETVLLMAAKSSVSDPTKFLTEQGANVNVSAPGGQTPLFYAACYGKTENVRLLLNAGAKTSALAPDPDRPDSPLYNAVTIAELKKFPAIAALLRTRLNASLAENESKAVHPPASAPTNRTVDISRFWEPVYSHPTAVDHDGNLLPWAATENYRFREDRLWVLFRDGGESRKIFAINLDNFDNQVIELPYRNVDGFEVFSGSVYVSMEGRVARFGLSDRTWEELSIPLEGKPRLTTFGKRLIVNTFDTVFEITAPKNEVRLIASRRRDPPANLLDTLDRYYDLQTFEDSNGAMRIWLNGTVYAENSSNWVKLASSPPFPKCAPVVVQDEGLIYLGMEGVRYWLYVMPTDQSLFKPLLSTRINGLGLAASRLLRAPQRQPIEQPQWVFNRGLSISGCPVIHRQDGLWVFDGQIGVRARWVNSQKVVPVEGQELKANLILFEPQLANPIVIPIQFNLDKLLKHADYLDSHRTYGQPGQIGVIDLGPVLFQRTRTGMIVTGNRVPGFWFLPSSDLTDEIQRQRLLLAAETRVQTDAIEADWATLTKRYQLSGTNNFSPDDLEQMINDPLFIRLTLPSIDSNQDGWLDCNELKFFDANQNKTIDPSEEEGIQITQETLAKAAIEYADQDNNGTLAHMEVMLLKTEKFNRNNYARNLKPAGPAGLFSQSLNKELSQKDIAAGLNLASERSVAEEVHKLMGADRDMATMRTLMQMSRTNASLGVWINRLLKASAKAAP